MSDSNALVKLFGNLMGSMDEDDEKKAQGLVPEPPQLDIPPMVTPQVPPAPDETQQEAAHRVLMAGERGHDKAAQMTYGTMADALTPNPDSIPEWGYAGIRKIFGIKTPEEEQAMLASQQGVPVPVQQGVPPIMNPQGSLPASHMDGNTFVLAAQKQGLPTDNGTLNQIVNRVNSGMSPDDAAAEVAAGSVQQGVPELLASPEESPQAPPNLGFDGTPTLESVQPPPAQEDPYGHLDWGDANRASFPVWMSDPLDTAGAAKAPEAIKKIDKRLAELEDLRDSGQLSPAGYTQQAEVLKRHRQSHEYVIANQETNLKDRDLFKVKRLYDAGLTDQAEALAVELGLPSPSGVPPVELNEDGVPVIIGKQVPEVEEEDVAVVDPNKMTTEQLITRDANNDNFMGQKEFAEDKAAIDKLTAEQDEDAETLIEDDDKRKSFLSKLWDGVKSVVSEQFQDPTNQKAMFAYAISRALGYDGATIAGKVLEDGWSRQAEAEKIYGKQVVAAEKKRIEDQKIDYSKPITVYHPKTQKNYTIFRTKGGDQFVWEVGGSTKGVDISTLLADGYQFKEGLTRQDHRDSMLKTLTDNTARAFDHISSEDIDDETKAAIRKGIDPAELKTAIDNFIGQYPKGTDFINSNIMNAITISAGNYVQAIKDGRAVGSKDLTGYLDYEKLTLDIKDNGLPSTFFAISKHPDQEIGVNGWSKVNHRVNGLMQSVNSQLLKANKDAQPMTKGEVYKALYDEYVKMAEASIDPKDKDDNPFATYWEKASVESSDDKHLSLSPAMLWIQNIDKRPDPSYSPPNGGALIKTLIANRLGKS